MADWKIHHRKEGCARCEREFGEGEAHYSVLSIRESTLERDDLCATCFRDRPGEGAAEELIWWRTRRPVAQQRGLAVDFETVERLFHALGSREEERLRELRYLFCLLLMRKRRLKLVRVVRRGDGGEAMLVRRPRRKDEIEVEVFDLTPERTGELRGELEALFEGAELEEASGEAADQEPAAAEAPLAEPPPGE